MTDAHLCAHFAGCGRRLDCHRSPASGAVPRADEPQWTYVFTPADDCAGFDHFVRAPIALLRDALACMRACGWRTAYKSPQSDDGVLECAAARSVSFRQARFAESGTMVNTVILTMTAPEMAQ